MTLFRSILGVVVIAILLLPLLKKKNNLEEHVFAGTIMGTFYRVSIVDNKELAQEATQTLIQKKLEKIDRLMSTYKPNSDVSLFNAHKSTQPFLVHPKVAFVVKKAMHFYNITGGAFNITLDPLIDYWGFDRTNKKPHQQSQSDISKLLSLCKIENLSVEDSYLKKSHPNLTINLSSIAKGYAVDYLASNLKKHGFNNFLINLGGELLAFGVNTQKTPWSVGIENPAGDKKKPFWKTVRLKNQAIASSGGYLNNFTDSNGKSFCHIINPLTGYPMEPDLSITSVIAPDCMTADALATAFYILKDQNPALIKKPENAVFLTFPSKENQPL